MAHLTMLRIYLGLSPGENIADALSGLPDYCIESFREHASGRWSGEFIVSCPVAPELAEGDFVDEVAPHFPVFLKLKKFHGATFEFQIAVGKPASDHFELDSHLVAMLAALGASIVAVANSDKPMP